ncbi:hypothetical protein BH11ARM2_BH11ARM2_19240 [soil metagenome]
MKLAGLRKGYTYDNMGEIPNLWHAFGPKIGEVPNGVGKAAYGLVISNGTENGFDYMAAVEVSSTEGIPDAFVTFEAPAHRYAVFPHEGHVSQLCETIDKAFKKWLPTSGQQHDGPPDLFEYYGPGFCPDKGTDDMEVWVPVKA